jgi:hypothetical protein
MFFVSKNNSLTRDGVPVATGQETIIFCNTLKTHGIARIRGLFESLPTNLLLENRQYPCGVKGGTPTWYDIADESIENHRRSCHRRFGNKLEEARQCATSIRS